MMAMAEEMMMRRERRGGVEGETDQSLKRPPPRMIPSSSKAPCFQLDHATHPAGDKLIHLHIFNPIHQNHVALIWDASSRSEPNNQVRQASICHSTIHNMLNAVHLDTCRASHMYIPLYI